MTVASPAGRPGAAPVFALVFVLSSVLLMLEIGLTRVFSALVFYHFAFMAISLALFGLSVGGLLVHFRRPWRWPGAPAAPLTAEIARLLALFGVASLAGFLIYTRIRIPFHEGTTQSFAPLLAMFLAAALPFLAAGAAFALAFDRLSARAGHLYAFNLVGSALGCLLVIPLLDRLGAVGFMLLVPLIAVAAALPALPRGAWRRSCLAVLGVILAVIGVQSVHPFIFVGSWKFEPARDYDAAERGTGETHLKLAWSGWNSYSKVAIYSSDEPTEPAGWGLSRPGTFAPVDQMFLVIDNMAATPVARFDGRDFSQLRHLQYDVTASPYLLAERPRTLVIGAGGGRDVLTALSFGAEHVVAVELNPLVVKPLQTEFAEYTGGLYVDDPRVEVRIDEGRSFVRRDQRQYDVLQISLIDTWAATAAGAYSLSENTLYTVEAIKDYVARLTDRGVLSISRFVTDPPQQGLRVLALYRQAAAELGLTDFEDHVLVTAFRPIATCMFRKTPFTPEEVASFRARARRQGFRVLYAPGMPAPSVRVASVYHQLIQTDRFDRFLAGYEFDVSPCRDDRPFFFHMQRPRDAFRPPRYAAGQEFNQVATTTLMTLLAVVTALSVLFILSPLAVHSARGRRQAARRPASRDLSGRRGATLAAVGPATWRWILYFCTLGLGFMLFEIPLLQRLVVFLGHPVYATSVILFALLLSSGLGSLWSQTLRIDRLHRHLVAAAIGIAFAALWVGWILPIWFDAWIHWRLAARAAVTVAVVTPLGFLLGTLFPLGMRALSGSALVPWMWGWNGCTSVLGSVIAVAIAMHLGFRATFLVAVTLYLAGLLIFAAGWPRLAAADAVARPGRA